MPDSGTHPNAYFLDWFNVYSSLACASKAQKAQVEGFSSKDGEKVLQKALKKTEKL